MNLLKAILIQTGLVIGWGSAGLVVFAVYVYVMEHILEPLIEWLGMGHGILAGLFVVFAIAIVLLLLGAFIWGVKNRYEKIQEPKQVSVEPVVKVLKPTCSNCKHLGKYTDCDICNNKDLRLWNLSNCDINIEEWGCTYFEECKA